MLLIDKYAYTNRLKDFNPRLKIIISFGGLILLRIINKNYLYLLNIVSMLVLTLAIARIPIKNYIRILMIPMAFLIISLIMVVISIDNTEYIYSVKLSNRYIGITRDSLVEAIGIFISVLSSLTSTYFLILTTSINHIIRGLKGTKLPDLIIELMVLIYRSIFIFLEEAGSIRLGQDMRFGYINKKNSLRSLSLLIGSLFIRVLIKHKEMNISLECKLYDGEFKLGD